METGDNVKVMLAVATAVLGSVWALGWWLYMGLKDYARGTRIGGVDIPESELLEISGVVEGEAADMEDAIGIGVVEASGAGFAVKGIVKRSEGAEGEVNSCGTVKCGGGWNGWY